MQIPGIDLHIRNLEICRSLGMRPYIYPEVCDGELHIAVHACASDTLWVWNVRAELQPELKRACLENAKRKGLI